MKTIILKTICLCGLIAFSCLRPVWADEPAPIRIGWIGAMSGPAAKYGVYNAARIALDELNSAGGINGRPIELLFEDGRCESKAALDAAAKLINLDKVKYILGGHCSPETMPIAPLAERNKVILLAALSSNPMLTTAGDYIFRVTAVSIKNADLIADYAYNTAGQRRLGILSEETDYVRPVADRLEAKFAEVGGAITLRERFNPGETDFRTLLAKMNATNPDAVYLGTQAPDTADLLVKQLKNFRFTFALYGNESTGSAPATSKLDKGFYEGLIFAQSPVDRSRPQTKRFIESYKANYGVSDVPYVHTPEAYDALNLLAEIIGKCGDDVEQVKRCLYGVKDYEGASGRFSIDRNGDAVRDHVLMTIRNMKAVKLQD